MRFVLVTAVAFVGVAACARHAEPEPSSSAPAPPTLVSPLPPPASAPPEKLTARPRREILVGGCMRECKEPREALRAFLSAVISTPAPDVAVLRSFIDTSMLVHAGTDHGTRWAEHFTQGRLDTRRTEIDTWIGDWSRFSAHVLDPRDRGRSDQGWTIVEENQRRFVVDWSRPDLAPDAQGPLPAAVVRFTLRPRGMEWLVTDVEDRAAALPGARKP